MPNLSKVNCPQRKIPPKKHHKGAIQNITHAQNVFVYSDYVTNPSAESGGFQALAFNS